MWPFCKATLRCVRSIVYSRSAMPSACVPRQERTIAIKHTAKIVSPPAITTWIMKTRAIVLFFQPRLFRFVTFGSERGYLISPVVIPGGLVPFTIERGGLLPFNTVRGSLFPCSHDLDRPFPFSMNLTASSALVDRVSFNTEDW